MIILINFVLESAVIFIVNDVIIHRQRLAAKSLVQLSMRVMLPSIKGYSKVGGMVA